MISKNETKKGISSTIPVLIIVLIIVMGTLLVYFGTQPVLTKASLKKFDSCSEMGDTFNKYYEKMRSMPEVGIFRQVVDAVAPSLAAETKSGAGYSTTNIQVQGVDEADIVKTDGEFIYTLSDKKLVIAHAYPVEQAQILSQNDLGNFTPSEIFIDGNTLLIFGSTYSYTPMREVSSTQKAQVYPYNPPLTTIQLWNIEDKANPEVVRSVDFEGQYLTSRKIGSMVYFVVNSYPYFHILEDSPGDIIPLHRDSSTDNEFKPNCGCTDVLYFEPVNPENFITVASISMNDVNAVINKKVIVGSGQNIYASLQNLYIAEMGLPYWRYWISGEGDLKEKTNVHKFSLNNGEISYLGHMEAPGRILNQFSMDEHNNHFRIATTKGHVARMGGSTSDNNIYIFNENLNLTGKLEGLAPGERIYSARFMGDKGYLVTFKKIDPLFVIDLSNPSNPVVLGKLKIPGYSDYLHPYDEDHIIGIGKETVEAEEGDFAWYQGIKMAIFDVSDVNKPKEMYKVIIGDRGTDSYVLHDHKAFLFDRGKNLLVIPVLLAELTEEQKAQGKSNAYGEFVFQGAYVYNVNLVNGFNLKGRITHYDDNETFLKSGYYFYGSDYSVKRSLYIEGILYTISNNKIKLNSLVDLSELKQLLINN